MFFLLTGKPLFAGATVDAISDAHLNQPRPDPRKFNPDLPAICAETIATAMAIDPQDRYPTMLDFSNAVQRILEASAKNS